MLLSTLLVAAVAYLCTLCYVRRPKQTESNLILIDLPRIEWPKDLSTAETEEFIQSISDNRTAIVLTNHPYFSKLRQPLFSNDLISYFDKSDSNEFAFDLEYKSNANCPIFEFYEENLPLVDIIEWKAPNNSTKLKIKLAEYLQYILRQTQFLQSTSMTNSDIYSCAVTNHFEYRSLSIDLYPEDGIIRNVYDEHLQYFVPKNERLQAIKMWIGSKGVLSKFHFDASDNFNIQIYGKKLFRLIRPKYHWNLRHFPWLHPQSRKSQIGKNGVYGYDDESAMLKAEVYEVELNEGEIIYIPPIWDHEVIGVSDEQMINLNVWSKGIEASIQENVSRYPLPFDVVEQGINEQITKDKLVAICLQQYIKCLLTAFCKHFRLSEHYDEFAKNAIRQLVESRYDPLFAHAGKDVLKMQNLCKLWLSNGRFLNWYKHQIANKHKKYQKYANNLIQSELAEVDSEVGLIFLSAYFEIIAEYFLGVEHVYAFLSLCFDSS